MIKDKSGSLLSLRGVGTVIIKTSISLRCLFLSVKKIEPKLTNDVLKVFDLKNSINSKKSYGGTAFYNIKKMILKYKKTL